jgi:hypothetical protein
MLARERRLTPIQKRIGKIRVELGNFQVMTEGKNLPTSASFKGPTSCGSIRTY